MIQEYIALGIIAAFIIRLGWQVYRNQLSRNQFLFWLGFWFVAGLLIIFVRNLDALAARLGFSSSGIQILLYCAVIIIFYFIFRLRLKMDRIERDITALARSIAISSARRQRVDSSKEAPRAQ